MNTEDLIQHLGRGLTPVRRLSPPWQRAAVWLAFGGLYIASVVAWAWVRGGTPGVESNPAYVTQQIMLAATACAAALGAFASVIPGAVARSRVALIIPPTLMMAALVWSCVTDLRQFGTLGVGREADWPCVLSITLGGIGLWAMATVMLRRGAPLAPRVTSLLAGVAALSLANMEACVSRPHGFAVTIVFWHGLTTALLLVVFTRLGRRMFAWHRPNVA